MSSSPLLCASWTNALVFIGSNWGGAKAPAWVYTLRIAAEGQAEMSVF